MIKHNISFFEVGGSEIKICQQYKIYSYLQGATQGFVIKWKTKAKVKKKDQTILSVKR